MKEIVTGLSLSFALAAWLGSAQAATLGPEWYEASADDLTQMRCHDNGGTYGRTLVSHGGSMTAGTCVAIPVIGARIFAANEVVVTPVTFGGLKGTPIVRTEDEVWDEFGAPVFYGSTADRTYVKGNGGTWTCSSLDFEFGFEIGAKIWPDERPVPGRQWIFLQTTCFKHTEGVKEFEVHVPGVVEHTMNVRFVARVAPELGIMPESCTHDSYHVLNAAMRICDGCGLVRKERTSRAEAHLHHPVWNKARTISAACGTDGMPSHIIALKIGKANARTGAVRLSGSIAGFDGKRTTLTFSGSNIITDDRLAFTCTAPGYEGAFTVEVTPTGLTAFSSPGLTLLKGSTAGGSVLPMSCVALGDDFTTPVRGLVEELVPVRTACEPILLRGDRWSFNKTTSVRWTKDKATGEMGLMIDRSGEKSNASGMKLSYVPKTGIFKGAFNLYELTERRGKVSLRKHRASVAGFVVNGEGYGRAMCDRLKAGPWTVRIRPYSAFIPAQPRFAP